LTIAKLKEDKSALIRTMSFTCNDVGKSEIEVLQRAGFTHLKRGQYFVWKKLSETVDIQAHQLVLNRLFTQGNQ
jgi:hypothetical protein